MKKAIAKRWITALKSGEYRQVDGALKKPLNDRKYGYCCLGVLCDLYAKETGKAAWSSNKGEKTFNCENGDNSGTALPEAVLNWAGMKSNDGQGLAAISFKNEGDPSDRSATNLVILNDDAKYSFKKIAEVIKANQATL